MDICADYHGLQKMQLGDFQREILRLRGGVPGAIPKMCEPASKPRYFDRRDLHSLPVSDIQSEMR